MSDELKSCPFCGSEYTQVRWIGFTHTHNGAFTAGYRGECGDCWATTRAFDNEADAAKAWNTRADDALECECIGGKCSRCGKDLPEPGYTGYEYEGNYCPTCGAKLRKPEQPVDNAQADSRERLLEDVNSLCVELWDSYAISGWTTANMLKKDIIKLLDRQSAITKRELQEQMDSLTAELCCECNSREYAYNELNKMLALDGKRVKQINELTAERDELQSIIDHMPKTEQECEACQEAHDRLMFNAKLHQDELREKLDEKQHVCDVQRDSFLKLEAENAELRRMLADAAEAI